MRFPKADKKALELWERDVDDHNGKIQLHIDNVSAVREAPATSPELYATMQGSPLRQQATDLAIEESDLRNRGAELLKIFEGPIHDAVQEAIEASVKTRERVRKELTDHGVTPAGLNPAMVWHRSIRAAQETIHERRAAGEQLTGWRRANEELTAKVSAQLERLKAAALQGVA